MDEVLGDSSERNTESLLSAEVPVLVNGHQKQELQPLQSQVAGHSAEGGKSSLGILLHPDGYILKPAEKKTQRENEIRFYQHLNAAVDSVSQELKAYVPKFYGTRNVTVNGKDVPCIVLQNVTEGIVEPCVMDVKIGRQTWEPSASKEKRDIEKAKYVGSRGEFGFCIPGMQFYDVSSHELIKRGKEYGKKLDGNGLKDALKLFLNWKSPVSRPLILQFLCKLRKILRWFQDQRQYVFYSSSILFVYDAHPLRNHSPSVGALGDVARKDSPSPATKSNAPTMSSEQLTGGAVERDLSVWEEGHLKNCDELQKCISQVAGDCLDNIADVKMIDFAHTLIYSECDVDSNYIEGLQNLVAIFEILLKESCLNV